MTRFILPRFYYLFQVHKTSIVVEAAKYIEELKEKVEKLHKDIASSSEATSVPMVTSIFFSNTKLM